MNIYRDKRNCNWFWIDNNLLKGWAKSLGPTPVAVYACLCMYTSESQGTCYPSITTISELLGISRTTVIAAIKKLEDSAIIEVEHSHGEGKSNTYTILPLSNHQVDSTAIGLGVVQNLNHDGTETVRGVVQNLDSNNTNITIPINNNMSVETFSVETKQQQKNNYGTEANFELLYAHYPRKLGRRAALTHFQASVKTAEDLSNIQEALDSYNAYIIVSKTEEQYIKHASTWFNNWRDWVGYNKTSPIKPKMGAAGREL